MSNLTKETHQNAELAGIVHTVQLARPYILGHGVLGAPYTLQDTLGLLFSVAREAHPLQPGTQCVLVRLPQGMYIMQRMTNASYVCSTLVWALELG